MVVVVKEKNCDLFDFIPNMYSDEISVRDGRRERRVYILFCFFGWLSLSTSFFYVFLDFLFPCQQAENETKRHALRDLLIAVELSNRSIQQAGRQADRQAGRQASRIAPRPTRTSKHREKKEKEKSPNTREGIVKQRS